MKIFINSIFEKYYQQYPLQLVDIGASGGLQNHWQAAEKYLQVIGFEPDEREFSNLISSEQSNAIRYLNTALYKKAARLDFFLAKKQMVSSILKPNRSFLDDFPEANRFDIEKTIKLQADSIDHQFEKHQIKDVDFIKIDTQGSELSILEGANNILKNSVFGLEIEVEFSEIYKNQPLFSEIDNFIRKFGFQLFDLKPYYWKRKAGQEYGGNKGQLIFADALYFRNIDKFNSSICFNQDDTWKKTKVLRAVSICILYGYLDYALEIFNSNTHLFIHEESKAFKNHIESNITFSHKLPHFPARGKIANMFYKLWKVFDPSQGWASSGRGLGNLY